MYQNDRPVPENLVKLKSVRRGKNKKGNDRVQINLDSTEAAKLANLIGGLLTSPLGVKLDFQLHTCQGRNGSFESGVTFVKAIEKYNPNRQQGNYNQGGYTQQAPAPQQYAAPAPQQYAPPAQQQYTPQTTTTQTPPAEQYHTPEQAAAAIQKLKGTVA